MYLYVCRYVYVLMQANNAESLNAIFYIEVSQLLVESLLNFLFICLRYRSTYRYIYRYIIYTLCSGTFSLPDTS